MDASFETVVSSNQHAVTCARRSDPFGNTNERPACETLTNAGCCKKKQEQRTVALPDACRRALKTAECLTSLNGSLRRSSL